LKACRDSDSHPPPPPAGGYRFAPDPIAEIGKWKKQKAEKDRELGKIANT